MTTVKDLKTYEAIVRHILANYPSTRDSDKLLILRVSTFCKNNQHKIPAYETITRCRRKIQNDEGYFKPSPVIHKARQHNQGAYVEYATADRREHRQKDLFGFEQ